jgi:hypothetical protein
MCARCCNAALDERAEVAVEGDCIGGRHAQGHRLQAHLQHTRGSVNFGTIRHTNFGTRHKNCVRIIAMPLSMSALRSQWNATAS